MNATRKFLPVSLVLSLALLGAGTRVLGQAQDGDQQKCINALNKGATKVGQTAAKGARKCIKDAAKGSGDADSCAESNSKVNDARTKTCDGETKSCSTAPSFGKTDCTTVNDAAESQVQQLYADLYGTKDYSTAVIPCTTSKDDCKCQDAVNKDLAKIVQTKLKVFSKCKKDALKNGATSVTALETCLTNLQTDAKVTKAVSKLSTDLGKKCTMTTMATAFPGACGSAANFADCADALAECRVCNILKKGDALPNVDCDLFDDGSANGSCGEITCRVASSSHIEINAGGPILIDATGVTGLVQIDCGQPDMNGDSACTCKAGSFPPIPFAGQVICIETGTGSCNAGTLDCNGGTADDVDVRSDGNIGACASNAACSTSCDSHCSGLTMTQLESGCTGFCKGGANDGAACTLESNCPGGSCNGPDPVGMGQDGICQCHCVAREQGAAAGAGSLSCDMSVSLRLETAAPCDGADIFTDLGSVCVPLTTGTASTQLVDGNFVMANIPPMVEVNTGVAGVCSADQSTNTPVDLRGAVNFFGSAVGDLATELFIDCR